MDRDRDHFLQLLLRHETEIKAFIGSILRDRVARDDVFQEVALILWEQFPQFQADKSFATWARGVAAHKVLHEIRQQRRVPVALAPQAVEALLNAFERVSAQSTDRQDALAECLKQLPERWRDLLAMKYEQDLHADEIARRLQATIDAVYQSLSRIRARLADCVRSRLALMGGEG